VGLPIKTLVAYAHAHQMDVVALATHGRGGLARLVLGSVATGVLQGAGTPLLLVRPTALHSPATARSAIMLV
jgi:nucleotide-binding universal stress UspA family protein